MDNCPRNSKSGDRDAAIKLVEADRLFLSDPCIQKALHGAEIENDRKFFSKLGNALKKEFHLGPKEILRFVLYFFFASSIKFPIPKLQLLLDPAGEKFKGVYGFEQFVKRSKKEFRSGLKN